MRKFMTQPQRDVLVKEYLSYMRYENIISIRLHSDGIVQVTTMHSVDTYNDAILPNGEIKFDEER